MTDEQPSAVPSPPPGCRYDKNGVLRDSRGLIVKGSKQVPGAGRKHGGPYRAMNWNVKELCEAKNYNPFQAMIELAETARSEKIKYQANAELMKYLNPQLKAITHEGDKKANQIVFTWAADPSQIPTMNPDGSPVIEHRPTVEVGPPSGIAEEVWQEILRDDDDQG